MMCNGQRVWLLGHWLALNKLQKGHRAAPQFIWWEDSSLRWAQLLCNQKVYLSTPWTWNSIDKVWDKFWEQTRNSHIAIRWHLSHIFLFESYFHLLCIYSLNWDYPSFKRSAHVKRLHRSPREKQLNNLFLFSSFPYLTCQDTHEIWISQEIKTITKRALLLKTSPIYLPISLSFMS